MNRRYLWVALAVSCTPDDEPVRLTPPTDDPSTPPASQVVDRALAAGLQDDDFGNFQRGRGCAIADIDADGDQDLLLANPADTSYVMLGDGAGGFTIGPVLAVGELLWSIAPADADGDGDLDLFLGVGGLEGIGPDRFLRNDLAETGALAFTDVTSTAGVAGAIPEGGGDPIPVASMGGTWVDVDGDADLDLYVDTTPWPSIWNPDLSDDPIAGFNLLWRNDGDLRFTEVARASGLTMQASSRYSSWLDIDNDGDLDLFENNKDTKPNFLWRNDGGFFVDVTAEWSMDGGDLGYPLETFASTTGDVNQDGWEDLLLFVRGYATEGPYTLGHTLLINAEGRGFIDATGPSNLNDPFFSGFRDHLANGVMGATLRDLDGDGLLDVFAGNGGPSAGYTNMMVHAVRIEPYDFGGTAGTLPIPIYEDWSPAFDVPAEQDPTNGLVYPPYPYRTHAGCVGDLDGDGQVELLEMNGGMSWVGGDSVKEPNRWWTVVQDPPPRWLALDLIGDGVQSPVTPVGARVRVDTLTGGVPRSHFDTYRSNTGFAAQNAQLHFGLAAADAIERVVIVWPDGAEQTIVAPALDTRIEVRRSLR